MSANTLYEDYLTRIAGYYGQPNRRDPLFLQVRESILQMIELDPDSVQDELANACAIFCDAFDPERDYAIRAAFVPLATRLAALPCGRLVLTTALSLEQSRCEDQVDRQSDRSSTVPLDDLQSEDDPEDLRESGNEAMVGMGFDSIHDD
ncbi:hypothetical protein HAP94_13305 [Acidithiobacillus ferrivorans]|nr:hypothetical protein [Acidithiobacillus ferrivorans]